LVAVAAVVGAVLLARNRAPVAAAPSPPPPAAAAPTQAPRAQPAALPDIAQDLTDEYARRTDAMQELHALYLDKYDYKGLVVALRDKAESPSASPALKGMLRSAEQLVRLKTWTEAAMNRYGRQHPLAVRDLSGDASKDTLAYQDPDGRMIFQGPGGPVARDWAEIPPRELGAVIVSALREARETRRPVIQGALTFARLYALPQMTGALEAIRSKAPEAPAQPREP
jgi:hypothetical protein